MESLPYRYDSNRLQTDNALETTNMSSIVFMIRDKLKVKIIEIHYIFFFSYQFLFFSYDNAGETTNINSIVIIIKDKLKVQK